eukprot:RCo026441
MVKGHLTWRVKVTDELRRTSCPQLVRQDALGSLAPPDTHTSLFVRAHTHSHFGVRSCLISTPLLILLPIYHQHTECSRGFSFAVYLAVVIPHLHRSQWVPLTEVFVLRELILYSDPLTPTSTPSVPPRRRLCTRVVSAWWQPPQKPFCSLPCAVSVVFALCLYIDAPCSQCVRRGRPFPMSWIGARGCSTGICACVWALAIVYTSRILRQRMGWWGDLGASRTPTVAALAEAVCHSRLAGKPLTLCCIVSQASACRVKKINSVSTFTPFFFHVLVLCRLPVRGSGILRVAPPLCLPSGSLLCLSPISLCV